MRRLAIIIVATVTVWTGRAWATTVGVVSPEHPPPVTAEALVRVFGELRSLGLEPRMIDAPDSASAGDQGGPPLHLQPLGVEHGVDAVIALSGAPAPTAVEVWAADRNGRSVARRVAIDPAREQAPQTIAIRAIELLRSCLLEIDLSADLRTPRASKDAPAALPISVVARNDAGGAALSRFDIGAGAVVVFTTGGVGPSVLPCLRIGWQLAATWLLQADLAGAGKRGFVSGPAGTALVGQDQALAGIVYRPLSDRRLGPMLGLAAGALRTDVQGQATPNYDSRHVAHWSFLVDGRVGGVLRLSERWHLTADAHVQVATPYPLVRFVGQPVATGAHPNILLGLTAEARL